jgi:hypothetical protein
MLTEPFAVAAFLHHILPNLGGILGTGELEERPEEWDEIHGMLLYLYQLRRRTLGVVY